MDFAPINHIVIREDGKITIDGTRMRVQDIVAMHLLNNLSIEWIVEEFDLTPAQIHAALAYYYDHQEEIDQRMREADEMWRTHAIQSADALAKMRARLAEMKAEQSQDAETSDE